MTNSDDIVPVTTTPTEMEAAIIVATLEDNGIKATHSGDFTADMRIGVPDQVQILVARKDLARAQEVLEAVEDNTDPVDWSQVDVGEPETDD